MAEMHTPGPWFTQPMGTETRVLGGQGLHVVARVPKRRPGDLRLIVAAPTLLEAVKGAIDYFCSAAGTEEETVSALWEAYKAAAGEVNQ